MELKVEKCSFQMTSSVYVCSLYRKLVILTLEIKREELPALFS